MAYVNLAGSKSLGEAYSRAEGTGISQRSIEQWWNQYGAPAATATTQTETMRKTTEEKNKARELEIRKMLDEIIQMYRPGGQFGKGFESILEREKTRSVAQGMQGLVSAGLYGTTLSAGLGKKFEEEVAMPQRAKLEDIRYGALTEALRGKAGFVERIEDKYPEYGLLAQLAST